MNAAQLKRLYNTTGGTFFDRSHTRRLKAKIEAVATSTQHEQVYYFVESQQDRYDVARGYFLFQMSYKTGKGWTIQQVQPVARLTTLELARQIIRRLAKGTQE